MTLNCIHIFIVTGKQLQRYTIIAYSDYIKYIPLYIYSYIHSPTHSCVHDTCIIKYVRLAQLVKALDARTHVCLCVHVSGLQFPEADELDCGFHR